MDCKWCGKWIGDEPQDDFCNDICKSKYEEMVN